MTYALIGDIGGTNARFALIEEGRQNDYLYDQAYLCDNFSALDKAIEHYFSKAEADIDGFERAQVKRACLAIAGPVEGDFVQMSNYPWGVSQKDYAEKFGLDSFKLVNDFHAVAASIPYFRRAENSDHLLKIGGSGISQDNSLISVMGAGTGLGMALLTDHGGGYKAFATEGSDASVCVHTRRQFDIIEYLLNEKPEIEHVSIEYVASGLGLMNLYRAIAGLEKKEAALQNPAQITSAALDESCPMAVEALDLFCYFLGSEAGNQAIQVWAKGGIFLAGGIIPRFQDYFLKSSFYDAFLKKGRYKSFLKTIPIYLITHPNPAFLGLVELLKEDEASLKATLDAVAFYS